MISVAKNDRSFLFVCALHRGNDGSSDENAMELALVDTINDPQHAGRKAGVLTRSGVAAEGDAGGGSFVRRTQYRKLSKEQKDELDAAFQQNNFIDKVRYIDFPNSIVWFPIQSRRERALF